MILQYGDYKLELFFFVDSNLPEPAQGQFSAMTETSQHLGQFTLLSLYQDFTFQELSNCALIRFDLSFKYYLRNHGTVYIPSTFPPDQFIFQFFSVDIVTTDFIQLHNIYLTEEGTPADTHKYRDHQSSFYYTNAVNAFNNNGVLRLRFGEAAEILKLRVGLDDVQLYATCVDPHFEQPHEEPQHQGAPPHNDNEDNDK